MSEVYNISNAFKELDLLTEDTFKVNDAGIDKLRDFMDGDQVDEITIIDPEAETFDDVKESYIGKIILNCGVCQSKFYKDKEDIVIDEETQLANVGEECPYCTSADGFEIVGQVAEYCPDCDEDEDYDDASEDQLDLHESVSNNPWDKLEKTYGDQLKPGNVKPDADSTSNDPNSPWNKIDRAYGKQLKSTSNNPWDKIDKAYGDQLKSGNVKPKADSTPDNPNSPWSKIARAYGKQLDLDESRDLTKFDGTIAKLLADNMSKLSNITDVNELKSKIVDLLDSSAIKDKKAVADFKTRIDKIKNISSLISTIATYITGMKSQPKDSKKAVKESVESVEVKTDTDKICVDTEGDSTKVEVEPRDDFEDEAEMITPVDDEVKDEIEAEQVSDEEVSDEEVEDEDNFEDVDFDEFDEESFDELGERYLKKVYENVKSYKTSSGSMKNDKLELEGVITFNSGKQAKTTFLFEGASILKNGTLKLIGENKNFSDKKNAFGLRGRVSGNKLMVESFNYNYIGKDAATGQSKKLYGTIRKTK